MKPLGVAAGAIAVGAIAVSKARAATRNIPFDNLFSAKANKYGVPKRLMVALVDHESGFNPNAVNQEDSADRRFGRDVSSCGLGQILWPDTAQQFGAQAREELFDPDFNLDIMARLLRQLIRRYPAGPTDFPADVVSAYNAGHTLRANGGSFGNQAYVDDVRDKWEGYAGV